MAKQYYYLSGKGKFVRVQVPDTTFEPHSWGTKLALDAKSFDTFMLLKKGTDTVDGIMNEAPTDDDGQPWVNLRRKTHKNFKGKLTALLPPIVLDANGQPWPSDKAIGDGSDLTVKIEYYTYKPKFGHKRGAAIQMESVRVDHHVPFEINRDFHPEEKKLVEGLMERPAPQLF